MPSQSFPKKKHITFFSAQISPFVSFIEIFKIFYFSLYKCLNKKKTTKECKPNITYKLTPQLHSTIYSLYSKRFFWRNFLVKSKSKIFVKNQPLLIFWLLFFRKNVFRVSRVFPSLKLKKIIKKLERFKFLTIRTHTPDLIYLFRSLKKIEHVLLQPQMKTVYN